MTAVIFSKDRAMQLEAFLRSYEKHVSQTGAVRVLFRATSKRHVLAYGEVFELYPWAGSYGERDFRADVLALLPHGGNVVFFVDDQVFVRPWSVSEMPGLSLRLGLHLTRCYPTDRAQPLPPYSFDAQDLVRWRWAEGEGDWGYPLSLDGQVFDVTELHAWVETTVFSSPNMLEAGLQQFLNRTAQRFGACYPESKVVNVPWNRVQAECDNRYAATVSVQELLEQWEAGKRIDLTGLYGVLNESAHQEFPLKLEPRT